MPPPAVNTSHLTNLIYVVSTATAVLMALVGLIWSMAMVRVYRRDGRRQREGLCLRCGYDLRHTADRCPECGETVQTQQRDKFQRR